MKKLKITEEYVPANAMQVLTDIVRAVGNYLCRYVAVPVLGRLLDVGDGWWMLGFGDIGATAVGNDGIVSLTRRLHKDAVWYGHKGCGLHVTVHKDGDVD